MVFLIYGEDTYRTKQALTQHRERFARTRDQSGVNIQHFIADDADFATVRQNLLTAPFLAEKKLTILEGYAQQKKDAQEQILEILQKCTDDNVVICYEPVAEKDLEKSILFQFLKIQPYTKAYPAMNQAQAGQYFASELAKHEVSITQQTLNHYLTQLGTETWLLTTEAHKLAAYCRGKGQKTVTNEMVNETITTNNLSETKVFDFTDSFVACNHKQTLKLFRDLCADRSHPLQLNAILLKQMRTIIAVRDALDRGEPTARLATTLGIHPFALAKAVAAANKTNITALTSTFHKLIKADAKLKYSSIHPEDALCQTFIE